MIPKKRDILMVMLSVFFAFGCASFGKNSLGWPDYSGPFPFVENELESIESFEMDNRIQINIKINEIAFKLLTTKTSTLVNEKESIVMKDSGSPILALYDIDKDGMADAFYHLKRNREKTQDFGFIFDLNHDGDIDYAVFNGGPFPMENSKFGWMNYHFIDSNGDGKVDILIYKVDLDNNHLMDKHVNAWLYDSDFDGSIDKGEYLGPGMKTSIHETDDRFVVKNCTGEIPMLKKDLNSGLTSLSSIIAEVNALFMGEKK